MRLFIDLPLKELRIPRDFTSAERDVLLLVLEGLSNAAIAARRGRSARTVANQVAALLRKAHVMDRGELLAACAPPRPIAPGLWGELLSGRWRLVGHVFDGSTMRFEAGPGSGEPLEPAEVIAVELAANGAPNKQITDAVGLGLRATGKRLATALEKLGVRRTHLPLMRMLLLSVAVVAHPPAAQVFLQ